MRILFRGGEADQHRVEANDAADSIAGISRAMTMIAHYASTDKVRYKRPFNTDVVYYLEGLERGSLAVLTSALVRPARAAEGLAQKTAQIAKVAFSRAIGQGQPVLQLAGGQVPPGDIDALAEAIEPALRRGHEWVRPNKSIAIEVGRPPYPEFNQQTKNYLETQLTDDELDIQDVSVAALNVNGRNGRVFFFDLGRTVPFSVPRQANPRTVPNLGDYVRLYARQTGATVNIRFQRVRTLDGRLKRIIIWDCYPIAGAR